MLGLRPHKSLSPLHPAPVSYTHLDVYKRQFRYSPGDYESFANDFGFEETAAQKAAIHAVIQDMISPRPMDRLVCGDVGFGKTEVALRAAFIAKVGAALAQPSPMVGKRYEDTQYY